MNSRWTKTRQTKFAAYATLYILIVLGILTVANILASRYNKSYDSTANKRYSLSDETYKVVKGLKQDAKITYFDSASNFESAKDLLDRYKTLSPRIQLHFVDPDKDPQTARAAGITKYGTTVVEIGTNKETAKAVTEVEITGAMVRDLKSTTRTVCFVAGSGEHQIEDAERDGYSHLKDTLGQDNYTTKSISLLQKAEIPSECTVLVIGGPKNDYQQPAVDVIKKYIEKGGRGFFMLDPPLKIGRATADNTALTDVLQGWGVTVDKDLLMDMNPVGQLAGLGPQVALVSVYDSQPIVDGMKGNATGFPLSRSMTIKDTEKTKVQKLFESSESSFATTTLNSPSVDPQDPKNLKGPLTIAAAGNYIIGKDQPEGRFVVIGSSSWAANSFLNFNGNSDLALNAVNWLSSDEDLISIRPKADDTHVFTMTKAQFNWVRISSQFLLPMALLLAGVSVWWRRR